jgi:hypothetical protein
MFASRSLRTILSAITIVMVAPPAFPAEEKEQFPKAEEFYLIVCKASGAVLEIDPDSIGSNGGRAQQWEVKGQGQAWQHWKFQSLNDGTFKLVNKTSSKVLDAHAADINKDGTSISQWTWHGGANQRWKLVAVDKTYFKIVNAQSGRVLDITFPDITRNGARAQLWTYGEDNPSQQLFEIIPVTQK